MRAKKRERARQRGWECASRPACGRRRWNFYWSTWFISFCPARPWIGIFFCQPFPTYIFLNFYFFFEPLTRHFLWARHVSPAGGKKAADFGCDNCNCSSSGKKVEINEIKMQVLPGKAVYLVNQCNWPVHLGTQNLMHHRGSMPGMSVPIGNNVARFSILESLGNCFI